MKYLEPRKIVYGSGSQKEWMNVHYVLSFVWQQILDFFLLFVFLSCNLHKLHFESKLKILVSHALLHILKVVKDFEGWDV
jgi:predicted metallopeptidase